jgi:hypothetical protein
MHETRGFEKFGSQLSVLGARKRLMSIFRCLTVAVMSDSVLPATILFVLGTPWPVIIEDIKRY